MLNEFIAQHVHGAPFIEFMLIFGIDDIWIAIAIMVVSAALTALTAKSPHVDNAAASTLQDFNIPQIAEGTAQTVVFGDVWLTEWQVLWYGDLNTDPIRAASSGGKK